MLQSTLDAVQYITNQVTVVHTKELRKFGGATAPQLKVCDLGFVVFGRQRQE
jgi:hypothetical protein